MQNYLLQFSGEDPDDLLNEINLAKRKAKWLAMTEEEKIVEIGRIRKLIIETLEKHSNAQ